MVSPTISVKLTLLFEEQWETCGIWNWRACILALALLPAECVILGKSTNFSGTQLLQLGSRKNNVYLTEFCKDLIK